MPLPERSAKKPGAAAPGEAARAKRVLLLIEDSAAQRAQLRRTFEATGEFDEIIEAADGVAGLKALYSRSIDAVICDLELPGFDGEKLLAAKGQRPELAGAPILFVSANRDPELKARLLRRGASDTIEKPFHPEELVARLAVHLRLGRLQAELREKNELLEVLSTTDVLTGLRNRRFAEDTLSQEYTRARRHGNALSVLLLDVDHFKLVNDTRGHRVGDAALRHVAEVIGALVRTTDVAARYGGEEFLVVLPQTPVEGAAALAERQRAEVERSEVRPAEGGPLHLTVSIGVAALAACDGGSEDLVGAADRALYEAKAAGRNRVIVAQR